MKEQVKIRVSILRIFLADKEKETEETFEAEYKNGVYFLNSNFTEFKKLKQEGFTEIEILLSSESISSVISHLEYRLLREKLNPIESALLFDELKQLYGTTTNKLASRLNKTVGDVSNKRRLLKLPLYIQSDIISNKLTERHGRAILQLVSKGYDKEIKNIYDEVVFKQLKVSDTEKIIDRVIGKQEQKKEVKSFDKSSLKNRLSVPVINQLEIDFKNTVEMINKHYPQIEVVKEDGLEGNDYVLKIFVKNVK